MDWAFHGGVAVKSATAGLIAGVSAGVLAGTGLILEADPKEALGLGGAVAAITGALSVVALEGAAAAVSFGKGVKGEVDSILDEAAKASASTGSVHVGRS